MAQLANGHAAEREPVFSSKGLEPFNRLLALDGIVLLALGRFEGLQNDILSVFKRPCVEPLIDKRLDFGPGDLDRQSVRLHVHYLVNVIAKSGHLVFVGDAAKEYGFTDIDGRYIENFYRAAGLL